MRAAAGWAHSDRRGRGRGVNGYGEGRTITGGGLCGVDRRDLRDGHIAVLFVEDVVFGLGGAVDMLRGIGLSRHELGGDVFGEEELSDVCGVASGVGFLVGMAAQPHLEVDVVDAALVEAGEDGLECDSAVRAGELDSAEEGEMVGQLRCGRPAVRRATQASWAKARRRAGGSVSRRWAAWASRPAHAHVRFGLAGVEAKPIAVPEVDGCVGQRGARARVDEVDTQGERDAGLVFCDGGADQFVGDVERTDLLLRDQSAGRRGGKCARCAGERCDDCGGNGGSDECTTGDLYGEPRFSCWWKRRGLAHGDYALTGF